MAIDDNGGVEVGDAATPVARAGAVRDFWLFWAGQTLSTMGRGFSAFAFPLIIYRLTGSALSLALVPVALFSPELLFGLFIGAWSDRVDRKRLMIIADIGRFTFLATTATIGLSGHLHVWMLYVTLFCGATLDIAFESSEYAAIPSLINGEEDYVRGNARMVSGYYIGALSGPLLAGLFVLIAPLSGTLLVDAATYLCSALALSFVRTRFTAEARDRSATSMWHDAMAGLRYVARVPTLRNLALIATVAQFVGSGGGALLVLFASVRLHADKLQISFLVAAEGATVLILAMGAAYVSRRFGPRGAILGTLLVRGGALVVFALCPWYWISLPLWGLASGLSDFYSIHTDSLRQAIVPENMLGRVISIARMTAYSAIPLGSLAAALVINWISLDAAYVVMGVLTMLIPIAFALGGGVIAAPHRDAQSDEVPPSQEIPVAALT